MEQDTGNGASTGSGGLEGDNGGIVERPIIVEPIAGAIDPDTARSTNTDGTGVEDFAASFAEPATEQRTPGKRGRKAGSTNKRKETSEAALNINGVEKILFSLHAFASLVVPEMELEESEAKKLAKSIEGVTDQYKLTLDPKTAAYIDLATVCGMIYGPRAFAFYVRTNAAKPKAAPRQATDNNVHTLHPVTPANRPQGPIDPLAFDPQNQRPLDGG